MEPKKTGISKISYSQYSMFMTCPYSWKLSYIDKLKEYVPNINLGFGTAIHSTLEELVNDWYKNQCSEAILRKGWNKKFQKYFLDEMTKLEEFENKNNSPYFKKPSKEEIQEFLDDGISIINEFILPSNIYNYFSVDWELFSSEATIEDRMFPKATLEAKLDLVLKHKTSDTYKIIDFKTSTNGWNKYQKDDPLKFNQLLLYKSLFCREHNIGLSSVSVEFIILKRKFYNDENRFERKISRFSPANGSISCKAAIDSFCSFLSNCYNEDGSRNTSIVYEKTPGKNNKNCKYCEFYKVHCEGKYI